MIIYDLLFVLLLIVCIISGIKISNKKLNIAIQVVLLSLVSGLRYQETIGSDFNAYKIIFENSIYGVNTEFLYWVLNFVVRIFTDNFNVFLILISLIINSIIVIIIHKYSAMPNLSVVIYYVLGGYFGSFNIMRQYLAITLYWLVIHYFISNNKKKAIIVSLIGILAHKSIIVILLITMLLIKLSEKIKKSNLILMIIISHIFYFLEPILKIAVGSILYNDYLQSDMFNYGASLNIYILELFIIGFVIINLKKDFKIYNNYELFLIVSMIPSFILSIMSMRGVLYARFMSYFYAYRIILIPNLLYRKEKKEQILLLYFFIIFLIMYFVLLTRQDILVYKNFIQDIFLQ